MAAIISTFLGLSPDEDLWFCAVLHGLLLSAVVAEGIAEVQVHANTWVLQAGIMIFDRSWTFRSRANSFTLKDESKMHMSVGHGDKQNKAKKASSLLKKWHLALFSSLGYLAAEGKQLYALVQLKIITVYHFIVDTLT